MSLTDDNPSLPSPGRKRLWFRLLAVLLPVVLIPTVTETALRLTGQGYPTAFLIQRDGSLTDNYHFSWRFFPDAVARAPQPVRIAPERDGRFRIVIYGESAAMGDPEPAIGMPRMLEALLEARFPDKNFEIVNTAMTAVNSWAIADIASDLSEVPADVAVMYIGNNEVVGPFGAGTAFGSEAPSPWWVRSQLAFRRTRTGQWLKSRSEARTAPAVWQGMEMFLDRQVPEGSPALARVRESFTGNLGRIVDAASRRSPVLVSPAAVNLRDCAPFASVRQAGRAVLPAEAGPVELAQEWNADPGCAETAWRLARARLAAGDNTAAREGFRRALDLDTLRFRCDTVMQSGAAAALTNRSGVKVLDAQQRLDSLSPDGIAGEVFFHEHVHLTARGAREVALLFAEEIAKTLTGSAAAPEWPDLDACLRRLVFTPWHEIRLLEEMQGRFRKEPFASQTGSEERMAVLARKIEALKKEAGPAAMQRWCEEAEAACAAHPEDWKAAIQAALLLEAAGREEALTLLAAAASRMPHQTVYQQQGASLNRFRQYAAAEGVLRKALALRPEFPAAWNSLGISLSHLDRVPEAVAAFQKALALAPDYTEARRALAAVLLMQKDTAGAEVQFRALLDANGDDTASHYQLGSLLTAAGRLSDALPHYLAVARLLPNDTAAQINAGALLQKLGRTEEATRLLRRALELDPGNATVLRLLSPPPAAASAPASP